MKHVVLQKSKYSTKTQDNLINPYNLIYIYTSIHKHEYRFDVTGQLNFTKLRLFKLVLI